ncbi:MAG: copper chaperone PCu(A)C [Devosia sp.]
MTTSIVRAALAAALLATLVGPAFAHATVWPETAATGETVDATFTITHCDGAPTTEVQVKLPEGFTAVDATAKPGWKSELARHEVRWTGGSVPEDEFAEFTVRGTVAGAEGRLAFPLTQVCANGRSVAWTEIAAEGQQAHDLEHPAPVMQIRAAATVTVGTLSLSGAFTRATLPNAPVGGGFLTITNTGGEADRLVGAASPVAQKVQLHEMTMAGDVMKMGELENGVEIPAGQTVALAPGGLHIMFMGLKAPFVEGGTVPVTLTFEKAGPVEIELVVGAVAADHAGH